MKKLSEVFKNYQGEDVLIKDIKTNSTEIEEGDLFFCIKGLKVDRHDYIDDAIKNGARALVVSKDGDYKLPYVKVDNTNEILKDVLETFYDSPQNSLKLIGVTGTDGKTTTASFIQQILGDDKCGYIGTNGVSCKDYYIKTHNTTPDINRLYPIFAKFKELGMEYVAIETSSEAFYHKRLAPFTFEIGGISNITSEHLNVHKTLENYVDCKKQLFRQTKAVCVLNKDDKHYEEMLDACHNYQTYGKGIDNDLWIKDFKLYPDHTNITFVYKNENYNFDVPVLGDFNVENLAEAFLICLNLGMDFKDIIDRCQKIDVDGRMQAINLGQDFYCIVDYAHTANGTKRFMEFINMLDVNKKIAVIGQAGGRDPYKRKIVGKNISDGADIAIFTAEDPRFEKVSDICNDMIEDVTKDNYVIIEDRKEAIYKAVELAEKDDIILILGKGNEKYMVYGEEYRYFNDIEEVKAAISAKLAKNPLHKA